MAANKKLVDKKDLPEGKLHKIEKDGKEYLLALSDNGPRVCRNSCPHQGASLHTGHFDGKSVICPWHNSRFDVETGRILEPPALDDLETYEVTEDDEAIYIGGPKKKPRPGVKGKKDATYIVVGGGAAGNAGAEMLRKEGFTGRIIIVTQERFLPYDRTKLSKGYVVGSVDQKKLPLRERSFYKKQGIEIKTNHKVARVDHRIEGHPGR